MTQRLSSSPRSWSGRSLESEDVPYPPPQLQHDHSLDPSPYPSPQLQHDHSLDPSPYPGVSHPLKSGEISPALSDNAPVPSHESGLGFNERIHGIDRQFDDFSSHMSQVPPPTFWACPPFTVPGTATHPQMPQQTVPSTSSFKRAMSVDGSPHAGIDLSKARILRPARSPSSSAAQSSMPQNIPHEIERRAATDDDKLDGHIERMPGGGIKRWKCNFPRCNVAKSWRNKEDARTHVRQHLGETTLYWCKACNKSFACMKNASRHKLNQGRKHACTKCDSIFTRVDYRNKHMKTCRGRKLGPGAALFSVSE